MIEFVHEKDGKKRDDEDLLEEEQVRNEIAPGKRTRTALLESDLPRSRRPSGLRPRVVELDELDGEIAERPRIAPGKRTHTERLAAQRSEKKARARSRKARSSRRSGPNGRSRKSPARVQLPWRGRSAAVRTVQRKASGDAVSDDLVRAAAERGLGGSSSQTLPHHDAIQHAFGRFDISFIRAHFGDAVADACEAMNAEAFAAGGRVAFRQTPDLFTAAHEAAHVLQQIAGETPAGGIDRRGDRYEKQADAIAERVVRGESAEPLIAEMLGQTVRQTGRRSGGGQAGGASRSSDGLASGSVTGARGESARKSPERSAGTSARKSSARRHGEAGRAGSGKAGRSAPFARVTPSGSMVVAVQRLQLQQSRVVEDPMNDVTPYLDRKALDLANALPHELLSKVQGAFGLLTGLPDELRAAIESGDVGAVTRALAQVTPDTLKPLEAVFGGYEQIRSMLARVTTLPGNLRSAAMSGNASAFASARGALPQGQQQRADSTLRGAFDGATGTTGAGSSAPTSTAATSSAEATTAGTPGPAPTAAATETAGHRNLLGHLRRVTGVDLNAAGADLGALLDPEKIANPQQLIADVTTQLPGVLGQLDMESPIDLQPFLAAHSEQLRQVMANVLPGLPQVNDSPADAESSRPMDSAARSGGVSSPGPTEATSSQRSGAPRGGRSSVEVASQLGAPAQSRGQRGARGQATGMPRSVEASAVTQLADLMPGASSQGASQLEEVNAAMSDVSGLLQQAQRAVSQINLGGSIDQAIQSLGAVDDLPALFTDAAAQMTEGAQVQGPRPPNPEASLTTPMFLGVPGKSGGTSEVLSQVPQQLGDMLGKANGGLDPTNLMQTAVQQVGEHLNGVFAPVQDIISEVGELASRVTGVADIEGMTDLVKDFDPREMAERAASALAGEIDGLSRELSAVGGDSKVLDQLAQSVRDAGMAEKSGGVAGISAKDLGDQDQAEGEGERDQDAEGVEGENAEGQSAEETESKEGAEKKEGEGQEHIAQEASPNGAADGEGVDGGAAADGSASEQGGEAEGEAEMELSPEGDEQSAEGGDEKASEAAAEQASAPETADGGGKKTAGDVAAAAGRMASTIADYSGAGAGAGAMGQGIASRLQARAPESDAGPRAPSGAAPDRAPASPSDRRASMAPSAPRTASVSLPSAPATRPSPAPLAPTVEQPGFQIQAKGQSAPVPEVPQGGLELDGAPRVESVRDDAKVAEKRAKVEERVSAIQSADQTAGESAGPTAGPSSRPQGPAGRGGHAATGPARAVERATAAGPAKPASASRGASSKPSTADSAAGATTGERASRDGRRASSRASGESGARGQSKQGGQVSPTIASTAGRRPGGGDEISAQERVAQASPAPQTGEASTQAVNAVPHAQASSFTPAERAQGQLASPVTQSQPGPGPKIPEVPTPAPATSKPSGQVGSAAINAVPDTVDVSGDVSRGKQELTQEKASEERVPPQSQSQQASQIAPLEGVAGSTYSAAAARKGPALETSTAEAQSVTQASLAREQGEMAGLLAQREGDLAKAAQVDPFTPPTVAGDQVKAMSDSAAAAAEMFAPAVVDLLPTAETQQRIAETQTLGEGAAMPEPQATEDPGELPEFDTSALDQATDEIGGNLADARATVNDIQSGELNIEPPGGGGGASGGAGGGTAGGAPSREAAIAGIEADMASQVQSQAPAEMGNMAQSFQGDLAPNLDQAQAEADQYLGEAQSQAQALEAEARSEPPPDVDAQVAEVAARENARAEATAAQARGEADSAISAAQSQSEAEKAQAQGARDAQVSQAEAQHQTDQAQAQSEFQADQTQAQTQAQASEQAAQAEKSAQDTQAQAQAQTQTAAEEARGEAEKAQAETQRQSEEQTAQSEHDSQVQAEEARGQAEQAQAQAQSEADVARQEAEMAAETARLNAQAQAEHAAKMAEAQAAYEAEIAKGKAKAEAEKAKAEAQAAAAKAQAEAEKAKGQSLIAKGLSWAGGMVKSLLNKAASILRAAQGLITQIMNAARNAAKNALDALRNVAQDLLTAAKEAIQGVIKAVADAIRETIRRAADLIRQIIDTVAQAINALIDVLTQVLSGIVEAFQTAINAIIDGVIAAIALVNEELAQNLENAVSEYRDKINQALDQLQSDIETAGQAMKDKVTQSAEAAKAAVTQAEEAMVAAVDQVEQVLHDAVEQAHAAVSEAIDRAIDAAKQVVDAAFDAAQAAVDAYFDAYVAVLEAAGEVIETAAQFVGWMVDKTIENISKAVDAVVELIPDSVKEAFIDFWNSPWREAIIIGLATIAAVAIAGATFGAGAPISAALMAAVLGGTMAGTAYFGGELAARHSQIDLYEDGKGIYIPGKGYMTTDADGNLVPPEGMDDPAALEWAMSNFQMGENGIEPISAMDVGVAAEAEGWKGARKGAISAGAASLGGAAAGRLGTLMTNSGKFAPATQIFVSGITEGTFDIAASSIDVGIDAYQDAIKSGKSPEEALGSAMLAAKDNATNPQAILAMVLSTGISTTKGNFIGELGDNPKLREQIINRGGNLAFDFSTDVATEASTTFATAYGRELMSGKSPEEAMAVARKEAGETLSAGALITTGIMTTAGEFAPEADSGGDDRTTSPSPPTTSNSPAPDNTPSAPRPDASATTTSAPRPDNTTSAPRPDVATTTSAPRPDALTTTRPDSDTAATRPDRIPNSDVPMPAPDAPTRPPRVLPEPSRNNGAPRPDAPQTRPDAPQTRRDSSDSDRKAIPIDDQGRDLLVTPEGTERPRHPDDIGTIEGEYTPIAGHGANLRNQDGNIDLAPVTVPPDVELFVFVAPGQALSDSVGNMVDSGQDLSNVPREGNFEGVFRIAPGEQIENLVFYPGTGFDMPELNIGEGAVTVDRPRSLSEMLETMGPGRYALSACRVEGHAPSVPLSSRPDNATPGNSRTPAPDADGNRSLTPSQSNSSQPEGDGNIRKVAHDEARSVIQSEVDTLVSQIADSRSDSPGQVIDRFAEGKVTEIKQRLEARGEPSDWVTKDAVIDIINRDTEIQRGLQRAAADNDGIKNPSDVLEASDPAVRLADQINQSRTDDQRLAAVRETIQRLGGSEGLLTSTRGDELLRTIGKFQSDEAKLLAMQMLHTGKVLEVKNVNTSGNRVTQEVQEVKTSLDGQPEVRQGADIADELYLLTNSIASEDSHVLNADDRMAGVKDRVERLRSDLAAAQEQLANTAPGSPEHDAATSQLAGLRDQASEIEKTFGSNATLLQTLASHDGGFFRDTLVPVMNAGRGQEIDPAGGPKSRAERLHDPSERFVDSNELYAGLLEGKKGKQARELLDRVIESANRMEAEGRGDAREALQLFAQRYSEKHGSFRDLLQDAAKRDGMFRRGQDSGELSRLNQVFGVEQSVGVRTANDGLNQKLSFEQEQKVAQVADSTAQRIKDLADGGASTEQMLRGKTVEKLVETFKDLRTELQNTVPELRNNDAAATKMAQDILRESFEAKHGSLDMYLAEVRTVSQQYARNFDDLALLGVDVSDSGDLSRLTSEKNAMSGGAEDIRKFQEDHNIPADQRLDPHKREELWKKTGAMNRDLDGVFKFVLEADADTRQKILGDPVLMQRFAESFPAVYPFMHGALEGKLSRHELLPVLVTIKQVKGLGIDPNEILSKGAGKLLVGDIPGFLTTTLKGLRGQLTGKAKELMSRRLQATTKEGIETYLKYERERIKQEHGLDGSDPDSDKATLERELRESALDMMADPEFMALIDQNFSREQKAEILSLLLNNGDVSAQDEIRRKRINPLEDRKNVFAVITDAADPKNKNDLERLRRDPAILEQLDKLGKGQRVFAMHLLNDTPAAKVLREMVDWTKLGSTRSWDVVGAISKLDRKQRDTLRDDPALIEALASKVGDDQLPYFQELMQLDDRNLAQDLNTNVSEAVQVKQFEENRITAGLEAAIQRGDHTKLLELAADVYGHQTAHPTDDTKPTFEQRSRDGHLAEDMLLTDGVRDRIADKLRISDEFRKLQADNPTMAAAVMDAVLGKTDPGLMQYDREMSKNEAITSRNADTLIDRMKKISAESFLREFVNTDAFAPVMADFMTARANLERAQNLPDSDPDKARAVSDAETALRAARTEMESFPFDISRQRAAEIDANLGAADRRKLRDAVRARALELLGSKMGDNDALVARALDGAMRDSMQQTQDLHRRAEDTLQAARDKLAEAQRGGRPDEIQAAQDLVTRAEQSVGDSRTELDRFKAIQDGNLRISQDDTKLVGGGDRETRSKVTQAERTLAEDRADLDRLSFVQEKLQLPLPEAFDLAGQIKDYEQAVDAYRKALTDAENAPGGMTDDAKKRLKELEARVNQTRDKARATGKKIVDLTVEFVGGKVNLAADALESVVNNASMVFGPAATVPVAFIMGEVKGILTGTFKAGLRRVMENNGGVLRASDIRQVLYSTIKSKVSDGFSDIVDSSWIVQQATKTLEDFLAKDLPILPNDLGIEKKIDEQLGQLDDKAIKRINKIDEDLAKINEGIIGGEINKRTPGSAGRDRFASSVEREARVQEALSSIESRISDNAQQVTVSGDARTRARAREQAGSLSQAVINALGSGNTAELRAWILQVQEPSSALSTDQAQALLRGVDLDEHKDVFPSVMPQQRIDRVKSIIEQFVSTSSNTPSATPQTTGQTTAQTGQTTAVTPPSAAPVPLPDLSQLPRTGQTQGNAPVPLPDLSQLPRTGQTQGNAPVPLPDLSQLPRTGQTPEGSGSVPLPDLSQLQQPEPEPLPRPDQAFRQGNSLMQELIREARENNDGDRGS